MTGLFVTGRPQGRTTRYVPPFSLGDLSQNLAAANPTTANAPSCFLPKVSSRPHVPGLLQKVATIPQSDRLEVDMGYKITSLLLALTLFLFKVIRRQQERQASAHSRGCEPAVVHQPVEPFSGFDFEMRMYSHIPFLYELHQRYGKTFQVRTLTRLLTVCTIAPDNIRAINTSKDFGVEPMRLPGLEYFCGKGFITTDGSIRKQARKLLKPSFETNNIRDLNVLRSEIDKLLQRLPKDGSTIDLQPLLYVTASDTSRFYVLSTRTNKVVLAVS